MLVNIMISCKVVFICAVVSILASAREIPEYIHLCRRGDPEVSKCVKESIEALRPHLIKGIPELEVPPLEPFHIDHIQIFKGPNNFRAGLRNIDVYGASDFKIAKLKIDVPQKTIAAEVRIPVLTLIADYDVNARVLVVPIEGTGKVHANATNIDGKAVAKYQVVNRDGGDYIEFNSLDMNLSIDDYNIHLDNLFEGEPTLGEAANAVLNDNKKEFIQNSMPFVEKRISGFLLETANNIAKHFRYDELFPED